MRKIAFLVSCFPIGGIERVVLNLLRGLSKSNVSLDLVLGNATGDFLEDVPSEVRIITFQKVIEPRLKSAIAILYPLIRYVRKEKPDVLISNLVMTNSIAVLAKIISRIPVRLILTEHLLETKKTCTRTFLNRWLFPKSDTVVAVSNGVAQELKYSFNLKDDLIKVIHNPVVDDSLYLKARETLNHPWFQPKQLPVILAIGRLVPQKDFESLIYAFDKLKNNRLCRLVILGEGPLEDNLKHLINKLNLQESATMHHFDKNPYAYMSRAAVFVLSSQYEGLPTTIIEALACGCQVVSTDCPYGPNEILEGGKYGRLVPVGNVAALANAICDAMDTPIDKNELRHRAQDFTIEKAVSKYAAIIKLK